jgi:hypothetical protein
MLTPGFGPPRGVHRAVTDDDLPLSKIAEQLSGI